MEVIVCRIKMEKQEIEAHIYFTKWNPGDINSARNYHLSICEITNNRIRVINHFDCMNNTEEALSTLFYYYPNIPYYFD